MFYQVVVPLLGMDRTSLICISTPVNKNNFYSELFTLPDANGNRLFNTYDAKLVCARCEDKEIRGMACRHRIHAIPEWKSADKMEMNAAIYGNQKQTLFQTEELGLNIEDCKLAFQKNWLEAWKKRETVVHRDQPAFILISCDPNAASHREEPTSQMALVATVYWAGQMQVRIEELGWHIERASP